MGVSAENWFQRHQLTVDEYHRMGELGFFSPEARVELIEGEIIDMAPIGSNHVDYVNRLTRALVRASGDDAIVSVQNPVRLSRRTEPEPDFALLRPRDDYGNRLPEPADVLLIVEVSHTSQRYDREIKLPLYAKHGIPEVWIIDVEKKTLSVYQEPLGERYVREQTTGAPGEIILSALPVIKIDLSKLFGQHIT
jgi:Uma2 family endonuclease